MQKGQPCSPEKAGAQPDLDLVRAELGRLLRSDHFKNSKRSQALLTYIVEETLAERSDQLKERLVGINVFGRDPDYDTSEDPVVRNAAIEVRKRLAQFYVESGKNSGARIELHPGTYIPEFLCPPESPAPAQPEPLPAAPPSRRKTGLVIVASVLILVVALIGLLIHFKVFWTSGNGQMQSTLTQAAGTATSASSPATAAGNGAVRILAGDTGHGNYVDRFGNQWLTDRYFTGGRATTDTTDFYFPPPDPELFRTMRVGAFSYDIPLKPKQVYELRLYFVEPQYRYGNKVGGDGENNRIFQVRANGRVLLNDFDIIEDEGFASTTVRAFKNIEASSDGKLHLQFVPQRGDPLVSAVELQPEIAGAIPPIRIHAAPYYYTDQAGNRWSPDNFYIGGQLFSSGNPVTGSDDPDLFSVARLGNFHYAIPVPPGHYTLTLYFAETWFHKPGQRVFNVSCNGVMLISQLDIFKQAGFAHVLKETFHGLQPNGQGKLLISFSPIVNYASVRALEVVDESH